MTVFVMIVAFTGLQKRPRIATKAYNQGRSKVKDDFEYDDGPVHVWV